MEEKEYEDLAFTEELYGEGSATLQYTERIASFYPVSYSFKLSAEQSHITEAKKADTAWYHSHQQ